MAYGGGGRFSSVPCVQLRGILAHPNFGELRYLPHLQQRSGPDSLKFSRGQFQPQSEPRNFPHDISPCPYPPTPPYLQPTPPQHAQQYRGMQPGFSEPDREGSVSPPPSSMGQAVTRKGKGKGKLGQRDASHKWTVNLTLAQYRTPARHVRSPAGPSPCHPPSCHASRTSLSSAGTRTFLAVPTGAEAQPPPRVYVLVPGPAPDIPMSKYATKSEARPRLVPSVLLTVMAHVATSPNGTLATGYCRDLQRMLESRLGCEVLCRT